VNRALFHRCSSRRKEALIHFRFTIYDLRFQFEPRHLGCYIVLVAALVWFAQSSRAATNEFFAQGVELSRAGQFPEATAAFEKSAQAQPAAGTLVNLGIADWRRGRAGAAILAWEQARWIDPFDARAGANLKFARQAAQVDAPQLKWFEAASTWLPPDAWAWLTAASLWLAAGMITLPSVLRWRKAGWQQALAALALGIFLFSLTADFGVASRTQIGFVVKKNAPLLLTPTREAEVISTLAAGEPARRLRTRGNYFFIRTSFAAGWINREQFGLVCPERVDAGMPAENLRTKAF
jgi:tetratricopeptide (TPR) repeat protein